MSFSFLPLVKEMLEIMLVNIACEVENLHKRYRISLSLEFNFTKSAPSVLVTPLESINLIKSDSITGNLNPC